MTETPGGRDLLTIVALARAGAARAAWERFRQAGLLAVDDDPRVLTVKARLLKDEALRAAGRERQRLLSEAAGAYARSAELEPATYPLINAATLALLAGDAARARTSAKQVLRRIEVAPEEPETPYWRAATRAEALLLLGRAEDATEALAAGVALAPRAWEDHASTLRQFRLILAAQGGDATWLDALRPPRSLHFGGHMSFDPEVMERRHIDETIASTLEEEQVGFGYGALAAGADIIVAEALLNRGAQLHVVVPGGVEAFASVSVDPFGGSWRQRFDALIERAETVRIARPIGAPPNRMTVGLADELAMGAAVMNADRLQSEAIQLLILDPNEGELPGQGATARAARIWVDAGRRQRLLPATREAPGAASLLGGKEPADAGVLAILCVSLGWSADPERSAPVELEALRIRLQAMRAPQIGPYLDGGRVLIAYTEPREAAGGALSLAGAGFRVGADYGAMACFRDPFSRMQRLAPAAGGAAEAASASTPEGSACVTEDFAAALSARGGHEFACEHVGELEARATPPIRLFALR